MVQQNINSLSSACVACLVGGDFPVYGFGVNERRGLSFLASRNNYKDKFINTMRLFDRYLYVLKLEDRGVEDRLGLASREGRLSSVYPRR
jgi:hypothetical protein